MNINKNGRHIKIALVMLLTITTIISIGWYIAQAPSRAVASNSSNGQPAPTQEQPVTQAGSQPITQDLQTQALNGITVTVTSAKIIGTGIQIGICYSTPDGGDWYQSPGHLFYGTYEILPDEAEMISEQKADGVNMGKRCENIRYRINDLKSITAPIKFSVLDVFAEPREVPPCDDFQNRLNTSLAARAKGLKVECNENSDGSIRATLLDKLSSVSQEDAQKTLDDILLGDITGPWAFTINTLNP